MAHHEHHRAHHGHHKPTHMGGHGSPKTKKGHHHANGSTTGVPHRGHMVMHPEGGDSGHVHPDHSAANAAHNMHGGFSAPIHYEQGHDHEGNEEMC